MRFASRHFSSRLGWARGGLGGRSGLRSSRFDAERLLGYSVLLFAPGVGAGRPWRATRPSIRPLWCGMPAGLWRGPQARSRAMRFASRRFSSRLGWARGGPFRACLLGSCQLATKLKARESGRDQFWKVLRFNFRPRPVPQGRKIQNILFRNCV